MTRWIRNKAKNYRIGWALMLAGMCALLASDARGTGVALFTTAKTLPEATVAVIDPEGGSSSGTAGSDVNLAEGDIILYQFSFTPVPDKVNRGLNSYLTEYIPPRTQVVGVRFIDGSGRTIKPRYPGLAVDGCDSSGKCTNFNGLPTSGGSANFAGGSIAQVHADTGIFYTTDSRMARTPNDVFITPLNGSPMEEPQSIDPELAPLLELNQSTYYAHNGWDYDQVLAFGIPNARGNFSGNNGDSNTPFRYGSPVAGAGSFYSFEATDAGTDNIQFNDAVGPWDRIKYPRSLTGKGDCVSTNTVTCTPEAPGTLGRAIQLAENAMVCGASGSASCAGADVTPGEPLPTNAVALRYALGETRTGVPGRAEVALRVLNPGPPIDPNFGASGANVNCMETIGTDIAARGLSGGNGNATQWGSYIGSPSCAFLRTLLQINVDESLAPTTGNVNYTLRVKNLSVNPETNVIVRQRWNSSRGGFVGVTSGPAPTGPAACPAPNATLQCLTWNLGTMAPSDEIIIETEFTPGGAGGGTLVMEATYDSTELFALSGTDFTTRDVTVLKPIALPEVTLDPSWDPTATFIAGDGSGVATLTGVVANNGTESFTYDFLRFVVPDGWSISGGQITMGGSNYNCTLAVSDTAAPDGSLQDTYNCNLAQTFGPGSSQTLSVPLAVPSTATGLYTFDVQFEGGQPSFGGDFETYLPEVATINVGARRTEPPVLDCPILSSGGQVTGTAEISADTDVTVFFNLQPREDAQADSGTGAFLATTFDDYSAQPFGEMYGGLEITATATNVAAGELESEPSTPCDATQSRACGDGIDNDGDGLVDFPADPGCDSLQDNDERTDGGAINPECSDGVNNSDNDSLSDWPNDPDCYGPHDPSEQPECNDGIDNDGDGLTDFAGNDTDCTSASDPTEGDYKQCQNRVDDADPEDTDIDFGTDFDGTPPDNDPGCHTGFDDDETDVSYTSAEVKPRMLLVVDTSGSMNWNTCEDTFTGGDGSLDCAGSDVACADLPPGCTGGSALSCDNGQPDDSRLFKVKEGLTDVVSSFGEAEFSLMRFKQAGYDFSCPGSNASARSGGWQGGGGVGRVDPVTELCTGFNGGDLLVSFAPDNQQSILDWIDGETNYSVGDPPPTLDQELRGSGTTPIAGALQDALTELQRVEAADDPQVTPCREQRVILVTDGEETCGGDPVAAATALAGAGYYVTVIGFAIENPTVVTQLNAIAAAGSESGTDPAILVDDSAGLSAAIAGVITESIKFEICNNLDDDCDGTADEDFLPPNGNLGETCDDGDQGLCLGTGSYICVDPDGDPNTDDNFVSCNITDPGATPTAEICNNVDDNCNGNIDEGLSCNCLTFELCNGRDDNCSGLCTGDGTTVCQNDADCSAAGGTCQLIDEGLDNLGDCGIDFGICEFGTVQCVDPDSNPLTENSVLDCIGGVSPDVGDPCDGLDNDCDCVNFDTNGIPGACDAGDSTTPGDFNVDEDPGPECYPAATVGCVDSGGGNWTCEGICQTGARECLGGSLGGCVGATTPQAELCDGIDNDCSDGVDEDWVALGLGNTCNNGLQGECFATGFLVCPADRSDTSQVVCTAPDISPGAEVCDGLDNDCDGLIDETNDPPPGGLDPNIINQPCGGPGCSPGTLQCVDPDMDPDTPNSTIQCVGTMGGTDEVCNGADDDCDGDIDEFIAGVGADCYPNGTVGCTDDGNGNFTCEGRCAPGAIICVPPELVCDGFTGPAPQDNCDGIDNDCDGTVDEDPCPTAGDICVEGECISPCEMGEFPCPFGKKCEMFPDTACDNTPCRFCVDDPCAGVQCPTGEACDPDTGNCFDLCDGVTCPTGETCRFGFCLDCFEIPCPDGEICRVDEGCVPDPCLDANCAANEFCRDGDCIPISCDPACAEGQICVEGNCQDDPCAGVQCGRNQACNPETGECVGDLCFGRVCAQNEVCRPSDGECVDDPCRFTNCPEGLVCNVDFNGNSFCETPTVEDNGEYVYPAGGGCLSASGGGSSGGLALLLAAVGWLAVGRRRRRKR